MFNRPHHQRIAKLLHAFNRPLLQEARCFFGGGTAIVLLLGEYRESLDIDFLYSSREGYRLLRNIVTQQGLGDLLWEPVLHRREVRADRDAIRTILEIDQQPIKVEFFFRKSSGYPGQTSPNSGCTDTDQRRYVCHEMTGKYKSRR